MTTPAAFKVHPALALAFAAARGFGVVVACDGGRAVAATLPFLLIEADGKSPRVAFHVARANPLAALAAKGATWLLAVPGADAYVSADWYASRDQVPTWLYETVQLSGPVHVVPAADAAAHLDALTARFELALAPKPACSSGRLAPAWSSERLAPQRMEKLTQAIVAIEMLVETVAGKFKLNQHKGDADHVAVANALGRQDDLGAHAIAARMVALRPHLLYEERGAVSVHDSGASPSQGGGI
jgi:transcriptional regulator